MPEQTATTLAPLAPRIPRDDPFVPDWVHEAIRRLDMLCALQVNNAPALRFGSGNATLVLSDVTQSFDIPPLTETGSQGSIMVQNGVVMKVKEPN